MSNTLIIDSLNTLFSMSNTAVIGAQEQFVACYQQVCSCTRGEDQKFLVVTVAAAGQDELLARRGWKTGSQCLVALEQGCLLRRGEAKFRVGENALQFSQAFGVGQGVNLAGFDGLKERRRAAVGKMQHVHDDVGIEDEAQFF